MSPVLFLQSERKDPHVLYRVMRTQQPVYYDSTQDVWGLYSYAHCEAVLKHRAAVVPVGPGFFTGLSYEAEQIGRHLARVNNGPVHEAGRQAAQTLLARWQRPDVGDLLSSLLGSAPVQVDWVACVGMVLPSLALLEGLGFSKEVAVTVTHLLPDLVRIMLPVKTADDARVINQAVDLMLPFVRAYLRRQAIAQGSEVEILYLSNLLGLLIQSHDAGRGLLCNALLQALQRDTGALPYAGFVSFVREVLRFDPPIHHTRRTLTADVLLGGVTVPAGATLLVMLASANRDAQYFDKPDVFDPTRGRAIPYLSFGAGEHRCMAEHFSIDVAATALHTLYARYKPMRLLEQDVQYEAKANARLPLRMVISS